MGYVDQFCLGPDRHGHIAFHHLGAVLRYTDGRVGAWSYRAALLLREIVGVEIHGGIDADTALVDLSVLGPNREVLDPSSLLRSRAALRIEGSFEDGATLAIDLRSVTLDLIEPLEEIQEEVADAAPRRPGARLLH